MKALIILLLFSCSIINAQSNDTNLVAPGSFRVGILHKPGHGAIVLNVSLRPKEYVEINLGPTFSLFWHGYGAFAGVTGKLFAKRKIFVSTEFAYRFMGGFTETDWADSIGNGIYSQYAVPASNFVSWGVAFNYRFKGGLNVNIMPTYNWKMGNYIVLFTGKGSEDKNVERRLKARMQNGYGLSVIFSVF